MISLFAPGVGLPKSEVATGVAVDGLAPGAKISNTYRATPVEWFVDAVKATARGGVTTAPTVTEMPEDCRLAPALSYAIAVNV